MYIDSAELVESEEAQIDDIFEAESLLAGMLEAYREQREWEHRARLEDNRKEEMLAYFLPESLESRMKEYRLTANEARLESKSEAKALYSLDGTNVIRDSMDRRITRENFLKAFANGRKVKSADRKRFSRIGKLVLSNYKKVVPQSHYINLTLNDIAVNECRKEEYEHWLDTIRTTRFLYQALVGSSASVTTGNKWLKGGLMAGQTDWLDLKINRVIHNTRLEETVKTGACKIVGYKT